MLSRPESSTIKFRTELHVAESISAVRLGDLGASCWGNSVTCDHWVRLPASHTSSHVWAGVAQYCWRLVVTDEGTSCCPRVHSTDALNICVVTLAGWGCAAPTSLLDAAMFPSRRWVVLLRVGTTGMAASPFGLFGRYLSAVPLDRGVVLNSRQSAVLSLTGDG